MLTDLDLMALHVEALFLLDAQTRLLTTNEPDPPVVAPRLYLGRTPAGNLWRFRHDLPAALAHDLEPLLRAEPIAADLTQPPRCLEALQQALARHAPAAGVSLGPAWCFPERIPEPRHGIVQITAKNDDVMRQVFPILAADLPYRQPCMALMREDRVASICFSSRNTTEAAEAGLETSPLCRGRGYATAVTAAWAQAVRAQDRIPLYSTSWDNLASRAVARKLGLVLYGADLTIH